MRVALMKAVIKHDNIRRRNITTTAPQENEVRRHDRRITSSGDETVIQVKHMFGLPESFGLLFAVRKEHFFKLFSQTAKQYHLFE
jgi:ribosomal protein L17